MSTLLHLYALKLTSGAFLFVLAITYTIYPLAAQIVLHTAAKLTHPSVTDK